MRAANVLHPHMLFPQFHLVGIAFLQTYKYSCFSKESIVTKVPPLLPPPQYPIYPLNKGDSEHYELVNPLIGFGIFASAQICLGNGHSNKIWLIVSASSGQNTQPDPLQIPRVFNISDTAKDPLGTFHINSLILGVVFTFQHPSCSSFIDGCVSACTTKSLCLHRLIKSYPDLTE